MISKEVQGTNKRLPTTAWPCRGRRCYPGVEMGQFESYLSVAVPTEKVDNTKRGILTKIGRVYSFLGASPPHILWDVSHS